MAARIFPCRAGKRSLKFRYQTCRPNAADRKFIAGNFVIVIASPQCSLAVGLRLLA